MQIETLRQLCDQGLSQKQIGEHFGLNQPTVSYWMKKHNLESKNKFFVKNKDTKFCPFCKTDKPMSEFYKRRGREGAAPYCKPCSRLEVMQRQQALKKRCVDYKGGKCLKCGYNKYIAALEFHHRNPEIKDFEISRKFKSFDDLKAELDKCDLLCCRCHREVHEELKLALNDR